MRRTTVVSASLLLLTAALATRAGAVPRLCFGSPPTAVGTPEDDVLRGTDGRDVIVGLGGDDVLLGRGKRDRLCGGGGNDDVIGGAGADALRGGAEADHLFGGPNDDRLVGGPSNDVLVPGPGADRLHGGGGTSDVASFLFASGVRVQLPAGRVRGEGGDRLFAVEDVQGSNARDRVVGDDRRNVLKGGRGRDRLRGGEGNDTLAGGPGADLLAGGDGRDEASFAGSSSRVIVRLGDGLARGEGRDVLGAVENATGSRFPDRLFGDSGDNFLLGDFGAGVLRGRAGDDVLDGQFGGSRIFGGPGEDDCYPGGRDCEFEAHGDPVSFPVIRYPQQGSRLENGRFDVVRGRIFFGITPPPRRVDVSIRRMRARGCEWFSKRRGELVIGPCAVPRWNRSVYDRDRGSWRLPLGATLPPGAYLVGVEGTPGFGSRFSDAVTIRLR